MVPIIHKHRYMSWSQAKSVDNFRLCLQKAMWTLAMSFSSQFEGVREAAYNETRATLEEQDSDDPSESFVRIEQLQTWIILTYYELLRSSYRKAWLSAGRVFRLAQALRLHEVDGPQRAGEHGDSAEKEQQITAEEHRRSFWFAYCLDHFISVHTPLPITLGENDVSMAPSYLSGNITLM